MAAVCNIIKFGFKKDDFGSSVGNVQEEDKPGVWMVSQETVIAMQTGNEEHLQ